MRAKLSAAEAKAKFSAVVEEVRRNARRFVIERHGRPAAAIISIEDLERLEAGDPLVARPAGALALAGAWSDVEDEAMDQFLVEVQRSREADLGRPVALP